MYCSCYNRFNLTYLTSKALIVLNLTQLADGACDEATDVVFVQLGIIAHLKEQVLNFIATNYALHRLSLATYNAAEWSGILKKFEHTLNDVSVYFSRAQLEWLY